MKRSPTALLRAAQGDGEALRAVLARFQEMARRLGVEMDGELRRAAAEIPARGAEYAASRGEYLCAILLAKYLRWEFVDAAEVIRLRDGRAEPQPSYDCLLRRLKPLKNAVLPAFMARTAKGACARFPRGGSDISGALVAAALGARLYENWTDVDGLMSADRTGEGYRPACRGELPADAPAGAMGAQVLHPDSLLPVMNAGIPTALKNSFHPERPGTRIDTDAGANIPCLTGARCRAARRWWQCSPPTRWRCAARRWRRCAPPASARQP